MLSKWVQVSDLEMVSFLCKDSGTLSTASSKITQMVFIDFQIFIIHSEGAVSSIDGPLPKLMSLVV